MMAATAEPALTGGCVQAAQGLACAGRGVTDGRAPCEQVEGKMVKEQRRMLLMEQLKSIKRELGLEKDDKSALVQR